MLSISAAYAVMRCPSVTFVHSVKMNKDIFEISSPSGSHIILFFQYQTSWQYFDRNPPNGGLECRCGRQKSRFWANIRLHRIRCEFAATRASCYQHDCRPIERCLLKLVLSTDGRPSMWCITVTVQVCLRHRKPRTSENAEESRTI